MNYFANLLLGAIYQENDPTKVSANEISIFNLMVSSKFMSQFFSGCEIFNQSN